MNTAKRLVAAALILLGAALSYPALAAPSAGDEKMTLTGDVVEYDSASGVMTATGKIVRLTRGDSVATGTAAVYNTKTKAASITGGVHMTHQGATLTADRVTTPDSNHLIAAGGVTLTKDGDKATGPEIDYYIDRQYALIKRDGSVSMPDGTLTADRIEAFLKENKAVGAGNAHMVSPTRHIDAVGDVVTYYGDPERKKQGKVVVSGHARATQDGKVLTGDVLMIRLDENTMKAEGGTTLVVTPGE